MTLNCKQLLKKSQCLLHWLIITLNRSIVVCIYMESNLAFKINITPTKVEYLFYQ